MSEPYIRDNEWWVCPYNHAPEVVAARHLPAKVEIHDATLRDGEQTPGIVMDVADKVAIAEKLAEVGGRAHRGRHAGRLRHGLHGHQGDLAARPEVEDLLVRARRDGRHRQGARVRLPRRHRRGADRLSEAEVPVQVDLGGRAPQERRGGQLRQKARPLRGLLPLRHDAGPRGGLHQPAHPPDAGRARRIPSASSTPWAARCRKRSNTWCGG